MSHKNDNHSAPESSRENPAMLVCDAKKLNVFVDIERCKVLAVRTLVAVWPAMRLRAMPKWLASRVDRLRGRGFVLVIISDRNGCLNFRKGITAEDFSC